MNYSPESVQRLLDSNDYGDRLSGVNQLRYLAPEIAFEMLQPLINDSNARVRYSAVSQLDVLGHQNLDLALTILRDRLLNDPEADVKAAAADAIGRQGPSRGVNPAHFDRNVILAILKDHRSGTDFGLKQGSRRQGVMPQPQFAHRHVQ